MFFNYYITWPSLFFHSASFIPTLLQFGRLPLNRCLHASVRARLSFQLLLFLPLLPSVDLPQLLQSNMEYRKEQRWGGIGIRGVAATVYHEQQQKQRPAATWVSQVIKASSAPSNMSIRWSTPQELQLWNKSATAWKMGFSCYMLCDTTWRKMKLINILSVVE